MHRDPRSTSVRDCEGEIVRIGGWSETQPRVWCDSGRAGDVEDREPDWGELAESEALRCPQCGQLDDLLWISDDDSRRLVKSDFATKPDQALLTVRTVSVSWWQD